LVLVRPENLHVDGDAADGAPMAWSGRITDAIFRGHRRSMVVETHGLRFNVEAPPLLGARVGDEITLKVPPAGAWAIRTDGVAHATAGHA
jgi:iron(III) transport system ATP-binding protein